MDRADLLVFPDLAPRHVPQLRGLFSGQWWTAHRSETQVQEMLSSSCLLFSAVDQPSDELVGFARVLTDGVFLALVLDVIVREAWRNRGVGAALLEALLAHPSLESVESVELVCQPDLRSFYERWGFTDQVGGSRLMRRTTQESLLGPAS